MTLDLAGGMAASRDGDVDEDRPAFDPFRLDHHRHGRPTASGGTDEEGC